MDDTNLDRIDDTGNGSDGEMCQSHRLHLHSGEAYHNNRWQSQIVQADESLDHVSTLDHGGELQ